MQTAATSPTTDHKPAASDQYAAGIARLRDEREALKSAPGIMDGRAWALNATFEQLKSLELWQANYQPMVSGSRAVLCQEIAALLNPNLRPTDLREPMNDIFLRPGAPDGLPNSYCLQWVTGALQVLAAVEAG